MSIYDMIWNKKHDDNNNVQEFTLTPRTEAKYNKIDEEFHLNTFLIQVLHRRKKEQKFFLG